VAGCLSEYRKRVNKGCYAHFFDLHGYGTRQAPSKDQLTNVVGGFSEKIFNQILVFEGASAADGKKILPSLEYIRENF
jgi:hypothetical protein